VRGAAALSIPLCLLCLSSLLPPFSAPATATQDPKPGASAPSPAADARAFVFERLNREYANEVTEAEPMEQGGLRVQLTSPDNRVRLIHHELQLTPLTDGTHRAQLEVVVQGEGQVEAEVSVAGATSRLSDQVKVPRQTHSFEGRVAIERREAGYAFTALELPDNVTVWFESRLADRFLQTCRLMGALLPLDCNALEALLSRVVLPLPPPGSSFLLPFSELTEENRRELDGYLGLPAITGTSGRIEPPTPGAPTG